MSSFGRALNQSGHVGDKSRGRENGVSGKSRDDVVAIGDGILRNLHHCLLLSLLLLLLEGLKSQLLCGKLLLLLKGLLLRLVELLLLCLSLRLLLLLWLCLWLHSTLSTLCFWIHKNCVSVLVLNNNLLGILHLLRVFDQNGIRIRLLHLSTNCVQTKQLISCVKPGCNTTLETVIHTIGYTGYDSIACCI